MISFCDTIQYSFDSLDDLKNCKSSVFMSPLLEYESLKTVDYRSTFHSKKTTSVATSKFTYPQFVRESSPTSTSDTSDTSDADTGNMEFPIETTFEQESMSLYEAFVFQLFEISNWTYNMTKEYPEEVSFTLEPNMSIYSKLFIKDAIDIFNKTIEAKNRKMKLKLNGIYTEGLSATINWIMDRNVDKETNLIVYDVGFASTVGYLMKLTPEFGTTSYDKDKVLNVKISVVDWYSVNLGGIDIDLNLFKEIKTKYEAKFNENLDLNEGRVLKKLLNEVDKFKTKISANKKLKLYLEGLTKSEDNVFNEFIDRDDLTADIKFDKLFKPLEKLIKKNNLQLSDIYELEMVGGAYRLPEVKDYYKEHWGQDKAMATHLNGDETFTFGGLYAAAIQSSMFRTRKFTFEDTLGYSYIVDYSKKGSRNRHNITSKNFEHNKTTFLKMSDILENKNILFYIVPTHALKKQKSAKFVDAIKYSEVVLEGLEEQYNKIMTDKQPKEIKLRVGVSIDNSGLMNVTAVELEYEYSKEVTKTKTIDEETYEKEKEEKNYTFVENVEEKKKKKKSSKDKNDKEKSKDATDSTSTDSSKDSSKDSDENTDKNDEFDIIKKVKVKYTEKEEKKVSSMVTFTQHLEIKGITESDSNNYIDRINKIFTIKNTREEEMLLNAKVESLHYSIEEKLDQTENQQFICADTQESLRSTLEVSNTLIMGDELTKEQLRETYDDMDKFMKELTHKKRFNSHYLQFKKDITEHMQKFKLALLDMASKQSYIVTDYSTLWNNLQVKAEEDEGLINRSLSEYDNMDKCKMPTFSMQELGNKMNDNGKKLEQLGKLRPAPPKKDKEKEKKEGAGAGQGNKKKEGEGQGEGEETKKKDDQEEGQAADEAGTKTEGSDDNTQSQQDAEQKTNPAESENESDSESETADTDANTNSDSDNKYSYDQEKETIDE